MQLSISSLELVIPDKSKSTEIAFDKVISTVERSLHYEQYTVLDWIVFMLRAIIDHSDLGDNHLTTYAPEFRLLSGALVDNDTGH